MCGFVRASTDDSLVREVVGTGVYFGTYEAVKQLLVAYRGSDSPTSPGAVAFAGGVCGMLGLVVVSRTLFKLLDLILKRLPDLPSRCREDSIPEAPS